MADPTNPPVDRYADDEIDLVALFGRLWAGKLTLIAALVLALLVGGLVAFNTPPRYQADALLQLEEKANQLGLPEGLADLSGDSPRAVTEIEIIRSRLVVGRAVSRLNLDWIADPVTAPVLGHLLATRPLPIPDWNFLTPYARPGDDIRLDLLDVPPAFLGQELILTIQDGSRFVVALPDGALLDGDVDVPILDAASGVSLRVGELTGAVGRQFRLVQLPEVAAITRIRDRLSVSEQGRNSGILRLTYQSGAPEEARRTLDAISQAYLAQNAERSAAEAESSLTFVEGQIPDARRAVEEAEAALNAFRQEQEAIDLSAEGTALLTQITTLETELSDLAAFEEEIAELYTRNHPEYQRLLANRDRLEARLDSLREEVRALPATQREVLNLTQDLELSREIFVQLRNRAQELQVLRASNIGNVRIVDTSRASNRPVAPRKTRILALAGLLGLVLGVGLVLLRSYLRKSITGSEDLEALGLSVFATLNLHAGAPRSSKGKARLSLVALETPDDLFVEGLRSLRTGLHFGMLDAHTRSVALTSPAPGVGKSFIAANLAVVAAQSGQKVCLIDADMRRGQQHKYFGKSRKDPGLADYLSGNAEQGTIVSPSQIDNLSVITSGRIPPNPSELLMRSELSGLIKALDSTFDLVIVDAPPVLAVTDPVVISRSVGAVIAVTRFGETLPGEVLAMQSALQAGGVKLTGAILNAFDPRKARKGGSSRYTYNYRYDYRAK